MLRRLHWAFGLVDVRPARHIPVHADPVARRAGAAIRVQRWREAQVPPAPEPWPGPIVTQRPAALGEVPTNAARLAGAARGAGWDVRITYSRGTYRTGKTDRSRRIEGDSVMVWMRRGAARATALYLSGASAGATFTPDWREQFRRPCGVEALESLITQLPR